jgi:hypothetical protein
MQSLQGQIDAVVADERLRAAETYRFMEEQTIAKQLSPDQWEELKPALTAHCEKLQKHSRLELSVEDDGDDFAIRNSTDGRVMSFRFNRDVPCIHYITPDGRRGHFGFRVAPRNKSILQIMDAARAMLIPEIVALAFKRVISQRD